MGFKIVVLGAHTVVAKKMLAKVEDLPWSPILDSGFGDDNDADLHEFFVNSKPSVVLNLKSLQPTQNLPCKNVSTAIEFCRAQDVPFVQLSTFSIFGEASSDDEILELREGQSVCCGDEEREAATLARHILLRTSWLIDGAPDALLPQFVPSLLAKQDVYVSDHYHGGPLGTDFIADAIIAIVQQILTGSDNWGVFHLHSADSCSEAEFCDHLVRLLEKELGIDVAFPAVASLNDERRMLKGNGHLVGRRCTDNFGIQLPTWRRGFGRVLKSWLKQHAELHLREE